MIDRDYEDGIKLLHFENLGRHTFINHFTTTRLGGVSESNYKGLNIGYNTADNPENVTNNRILLASVLDVNPEQMVFPKQTHTFHCQIIDHSNISNLDLSDTDSLITNLTGIYINIQTADCVPVLIVDTVEKVIGAVHAGWRGTTGLIVRKTIEKMMSVFNSKPENIFAGIGPSIGKDIYEVGPEVLRAMEQIYNGRSSEIISYLDKNKGKIDLWKANKLQLTGLGVPSENIEVAGLCTFKNSHLFFSSRKDNGITGRFASGIMLRKI